MRKPTSCRNTLCCYTVDKPCHLCATALFLKNRECLIDDNNNFGLVSGEGVASFQGNG